VALAPTTQRLRSSTSKAAPTSASGSGRNSASGSVLSSALPVESSSEFSIAAAVAHADDLEDEWKLDGARQQQQQQTWNGQGDKEGTRGWGAECSAFASLRRILSLCLPLLPARTWLATWMESLARCEGTTLGRNAQGQTLTPTCFSFFSAPRRGIVFGPSVLLSRPWFFGLLLLCLSSSLCCSPWERLPLCARWTHRQAAAPLCRSRCCQRRWAPRPVATVAVPQRPWCGGACAAPSAGAFSPVANFNPYGRRVVGKIEQRYKRA
ncbi:uncharacterized protein Tco025E_10083, partial [Trypanosoma conorhini]